MPRSRPLPPYLPPLVEKVRLRELTTLTSEIPRPVTPAQVTPAPAPRPPVPPASPRPSDHPLLEQVVDIEALAVVLLSALQQESAPSARHHTRIAKQIVSMTHRLSQDLHGLLQQLPPTSGSMETPQEH